MKKFIIFLVLIVGLVFLIGQAQADSYLHPNGYSDFDAGYTEAVDCGKLGTGYRLNKAGSAVIIRGYLTAQGQCSHFSVPKFIYAQITKTDLGRWRDERVNYLNSL